MFYIYHIPGIKIGCTNNIHRRIKVSQKFSNYEILEEHTDIFVASDREIKLQRQYGYKVDTIPYYVSIQRLLKGKDKGNSPEARAKAVANTDYIQRVKNTDYKLIANKIDKVALSKKISKIMKGKTPWNKGLKTGPLSIETKNKLSLIGKTIKRNRNEKTGLFEKN
jgi:hypothetical protein